MKRFKDVFAKYLFLIWIVGSSVFALVIHCLFSITAPNEWFEAKWGAGDILTFVSTVSLGLLAVWQNKKFKEENDISQQRLEKLTQQANELTIVSKIIEIESDNLARLRRAYDEFSVACDPQNLSSVFVQSTDKSNPMLSVFVDLAAAERRIDDSFFALSRELKTDSNILKNDKSLVKLSVWNYYSAAKDFIEKAREISGAPPTAEGKTLIDVRNNFIDIREKYLSHRTALLNEVTYGNLSLEKIKRLYHTEMCLTQK